MRPSVPASLFRITVDGGGVATLNNLVHVLAAANFDNAVRLGSDLNLQGGTFRFGDTVDSGVGGPSRWRRSAPAPSSLSAMLAAWRLKNVDTSLAANTKLHGDLLARDSIRLSELHLLAGGKLVSKPDFDDRLPRCGRGRLGAALASRQPGTVEFTPPSVRESAGWAPWVLSPAPARGLTILDGNT